MKKKTIYTMLFLVLCLAFITGCNKKEEEKVTHTIIEVEKGNDIVIKNSEITEVATYYNYIDETTTIQIFAVRATDDTIRVLFNTCGSCNPSRMAYFVQDGDYFECQNCGNKYHRDEIGLKKTYGCSPIAILSENKKIENDTITISSDFIESYKSKFDSIDIYENEE